MIPTNALVTRVLRAGGTLGLAMPCALGRKGKVFGGGHDGQVARPDIGTLFVGFDDADGVWEPDYSDVIFVQPDGRPERGPFKLTHILEQGFGGALAHFEIDLADWPVVV